ncbi:MAG: NAD(P)-dependent oxidoreductase [Phenylobacterium sp.]
MQILMTKAAHGRVRDRLDGDLQAALVTGPDRYELDGRPVELEALGPEVVWISLDSYPAGLIPTLARALLKGPDVRWTQVFSAGLDNPMFKQILAKGVRLSKSSAQAIPIAEYVLAHALSLLAPIAAQAAAQQARDWRPTPYREIGRTRWVLAGYGSIGREIARRIKPFGVDLTVVRHAAGAADLADRTVTLKDLAPLLPQTDVVVLACALNDETRHLANTAFFEVLKPGAILINIGRGGLVDEDALRAGLDRDQPAHAVLDVFETEPLPADSWFWDHPKVRVSAHTSNSGDGNLGRGDELFLENLRRYRAGEPLLHEADKREVGL